MFKAIEILFGKGDENFSQSPCSVADKQKRDPLALRKERLRDNQAGRRGIIPLFASIAQPPSCAISSSRA
jgi:hypothetical protein